MTNKANYCIGLKKNTIYSLFLVKVTLHSDEFQI